MKEIKENSLFLCPKNNCSNIPELSYSYDPFNPIIKFKCNSKIHGFIEEELLLEEYLKNSSKSIECPYCNKNIVDNVFCFCKNCKRIFHNFCFYNTKCYNEKKYTSNNFNNLYNTCLEHNNKYIFHCLECNDSFCSKCDFESHNEKGHTLQQILSFIKSQNNKDTIVSIIHKQRDIFNKIKIMINKLFKAFENDIIFKEKILQNYENNTHNYQYIKNFNSLKVNNNEKYEKILDNIIENIDFNNNKFNEELVANIIMTPFYYSMMINHNQNFNDNLIKLINDKLKINNISNNEKNDILENNDNNPLIKMDKNIIIKNNNFSIIEKHIIKKTKRKKKNNNENKKKEEKENKNKKENENNKKNENKIENENESEKENENEKENEKTIKVKIAEVEYKEIKNIKQEKSIFNMIILHSGNIATSSIGEVIIYNSKNLCSSKEDNYILQKINICKRKKVDHIFEFPDETFLCTAYSKIYRLKLTDGDKSYNILGVIELERYEIPTKFISLGNSFLVALTEQRTTCFLKVFIKYNEKEKRNHFCINVNYNKNNSNNQQKNIYEDNNSDDQSAGLLVNSIDYLNKKNIEKDKDFYQYPNNNINEDNKLLCSIFEIKKDNTNNNNEYLYEFIATSNSTYMLGVDKIEFYIVQKDVNKNINIKRIKKIDNISCSIEINSICQFNSQYICIGLQNYNKKGQINGYAIIDINKRELNKIIKDLPISSLLYNNEKKLLFSAMDLIQAGNRHNYTIKIYEIEEKEDINFKKVYKIKSEHKDIIMSLSELTNNLTYLENKKKIIIVSASMDSTLRIIKIKI